MAGSPAREAPALVAHATLHREIEAAAAEGRRDALQVVAVKGLRLLTAQLRLLQVPL